MQLSIENYHDFIDTLPDAVFLLDGLGNIVLSNVKASALFGYSQAELKHQAINLLVPDAKKIAHEKHIRDYVASPNSRKMGAAMQQSGRHKNGSVCPIDVMLSPLDLNGEIYTVCVARDVVQIKEMQEALNLALEKERELARIDPLTGAANRRLFYELVEHELACARRLGRPIAIVYIDFDNFKLVNDHFGHAVGDQILCGFVTCAKSHLRETDLVARLGGDEFALIMVNLNIESTEKIISRIQKDTLEKMQANNWPITLSIGVLTCQSPAASAETLTKIADNLMYDVKRAGKNAIKYANFDQVD